MNKNNEYKYDTSTFNITIMAAQSFFLFKNNLKLLGIPERFFGQTVDKSGFYAQANLDHHKELKDKYFNTLRMLSLSIRYLPHEDLFVVEHGDNPADLINPIDKTIIYSADILGSDNYKPSVEFRVYVRIVKNNIPSVYLTLGYINVNTNNSNERLFVIGNIPLFMNYTDPRTEQIELSMGISNNNNRGFKYAEMFDIVDEFGDSKTIYTGVLGDNEKAVRINKSRGYEYYINI